MRFYSISEEQIQLLYDAMLDADVNRFETVMRLVQTQEIGRR